MIYPFTVGRLRCVVISDGSPAVVMPFPGLGTIARHGDAYRWQPLPS